MSRNQKVRLLNRPLQTIQWNQLRSIVRVKTTDESQAVIRSQEWVNARPVTEIPGPSKFELVRGFLPGGVFYKKSFNDFSLLNRKMYGDIVMIPPIFGKASLLLSFNPDDFATVLRSEGVWPHRRGFETMNYHRTVHRVEGFGDVIGLLGSNAESWGKLRSAVNPVLMQPKNARLYLNKMLEVSDVFLQRIRDIRDLNSLEMPDNFDTEINCLAFESVAVVALNQQIGLFRKDRNNDDARKLFHSLHTLFELTLDLDLRPSLWKVIKTPKFHKMMANYDLMCDIIMKYIDEALQRIEDESSLTRGTEESSVLEKLLKIDKRVAMVMALDMLMAGVDTTSSTLVGILLCLAKSPEKQETLRQEIRSILPKKDSELTLDNMKQLPYLRACIKEGMRLYPIAFGTLRANGEDIVMSGYQVPKHQDIILNANMLAMEEKYYPKAKQFIPERWLRNEKNNLLPVQPFMFIPFGFGARGCVGKRLVELELEITVARLIRNFNMEFNYSTENAFKTNMINVPAIPLKFKFSEVDN